MNIYQYLYSMNVCINTSRYQYVNISLCIYTSMDKQIYTSNTYKPVWIYTSMYTSMIPVWIYTYIYQYVNQYDTSRDIYTNIYQWYIFTSTNIYQYVLVGDDSTDSADSVKTLIFITTSSSSSSLCCVLHLLFAPIYNQIENTHIHTHTHACTHTQTHTRAHTHGPSRHAMSSWG